MKRIGLLTIVFLLVLGSWASAEKTLKLAVDERYWYPFTYEDQGQARGMHIDIVAKALDTLGYGYEIQMLPRNRAIFMTSRGLLDGMISVAFHEALAGKLEFPPDAQPHVESKWRIMQVDHVVVTYAGDGYEFEGDVNTLPTPVRIPTGETLGVDLAKMGLFVDTAKNDELNFFKLMRDKNGSVVTTSIIAERMNGNPKFQEQIRIHATPLASQSYYLVFSPKDGPSASEKMQIWEEIAHWRDDYVFMLQVFAQY